MKGVDRLAERVARLDLGNGVAGPMADLITFVTVMAEVVAAGPVTDPQRMAPVPAELADAMVGRCRLLARIASRTPELATGQSSDTGQVWVSSGKPPHVPPAEPVLCESRFVPGSAQRASAASTKPFGVGLFTSTATLDGRGMWRIYLDIHRGSTLFPLPWHAWQVTVQPWARVWQVTTAARWVELVRSFPRFDAGLLYPDWAAISRCWDAVRMTLPAIVAIQGLHLLTPDGIVAPAYWDIESTFWLRWRFSEVRLVEVTR